MASPSQRVHVTRSRTAPIASSSVPLQDVLQQVEEMSLQPVGDDQADHLLKDDDEMPDTLKMRMENPDGKSLDCTCEAVSKDDGSVQYECKYVSSEPITTTALTKDQPRMITGKFSLNVPYVLSSKVAFHSCELELNYCFHTHSGRSQPFCIFLNCVIRHDPQNPFF